MLRSKLLVKNFASRNKILPKCRLSSSVFISDNGSCNCLPSQKLLLYTRNDIEGFKKQKLIANVPVVGGGEKCFSKIASPKCWRCEQYLEVKNFVCVSCGTLQYPKKKLNHFELFGFSQSFDINLEDLSKRFKKLQAIFHPDKYAGKTQAEKDLSETYSRLVNKAYTTLKDPVQRGLYLLSLQKYPDCNSPLEQEFLKTVMSKNEELEFISTEQQIEKFLVGIKEETEKYVALIKQAFRSGNLHEAKYNLSKLNYYASIANRCKEKVTDIQEKRCS